MGDRFLENQGRIQSTIYYWNTGSLAFEVATVPAAGGGSSDATAALQTAGNASLSTILTKYFSDTATTSNVTSSATNVTLLSANSARLGFKLFNDSTQSAYVKYGTTASSSSFTFIILSQGFYEDLLPSFRGHIDAIWASANGAMRVTELT